MRKVKFRRGDRIVLLKRINAIPAGCYTFIDQAGEMLIFSCGSKAQIGLSIDCLPFLRKSPSAAVTRIQEFLPKYYACLREHRFEKPSPAGPFSFCGVDASSPLVQKFEASFPFETRQ